jgi:hypothetical protein
MGLDTMLAEAAPARRASLDGPDSPAAVRLYQRITAEPAAPARVFRRYGLPPLALTGAVVATVAAVVALALIAGSRPTRRSLLRCQYRSAIFVFSADQQALAIA